MLKGVDTAGLKVLLDVNSNLFKSAMNGNPPDLDGAVLYKKNIQEILAESDFRQRNTLLFSVEEIYRAAGEQDKYVIFNFYPSSDAYKKYGNEVYGYLIYRKSERDKLEEMILRPDNDRSDGYVILDGALNDGNINELLLTDGFLASEVAGFYTMDGTSLGKEYRRFGLKQIPNTITIPFESMGGNFLNLQAKVTEMKLESGFTVLRHEMINYCACGFVFSPEKMTSELVEEYLLTKDCSDFTNEANIAILKVKYLQNICTPEERGELLAFIKRRTARRFLAIKKELGISDRDLRAFKESNPEDYRKLREVAVSFETDTISRCKTEYPIFWDFERFIHIYLRHYKNFFIEFSTARGTHFQYDYKDIKRLAEIITANLKEDIEKSLKSGKAYGKYGDRGYYFNGNYYSIRIDVTGRLMQFHPLE